MWGSGERPRFRKWKKAGTRRRFLSTEWPPVIAGCDWLWNRWEKNNKSWIMQLESSQSWKVQVSKFTALRIENHAARSDWCICDTSCEHRSITRVSAQIKPTFVFCVLFYTVAYLPTCVKISIIESPATFRVIACLEDLCLISQIIEHHFSKEKGRLNLLHLSADTKQTLRCATTSMSAAWLGLRGYLIRLFEISRSET